jgi:hypothetical protein
MSAPLTYVDRLEQELVRAIVRRRHRRTVITRLSAMAALVGVTVGALLLSGGGSLAWEATRCRRRSHRCE